MQAICALYGMNMTDNTVDHQDKRVKQLKRELEGWREVILPLNSMLLWEKNWYPGMLIGLTTTFFLLFWYLDPSVLTTISVVGLIVTLMDYLVPTLQWTNNWTGIKERKLEEVCRGLAKTQSEILKRWARFYDMRNSKPRVYYVLVVSSLMVSAWVGNIFNNLLLTYLFVMSVMLLPGLKHQGILRKYTSQIVNATSKTINAFKQKSN